MPLTQLRTCEATYSKFFFFSVKTLTCSYYQFLFVLNEPTVATRCCMPITSPILPVRQRVINGRQARARLTARRQWGDSGAASGQSGPGGTVRFLRGSSGGCRQLPEGREVRRTNNTTSVGLEAGAGCHSRPFPVLARGPHGWLGLRGCDNE